MLIWQKRVFWKKNEALRACVDMCEHITSQMSIVSYNIFTYLYSHGEVITL